MVNRITLFLGNDGDLMSKEGQELLDEITDDEFVEAMEQNKDKIIAIAKAVNHLCGGKKSGPPTNLITAFLNKNKSLLSETGQEILQRVSVENIREAMRYDPEHAQRITSLVASVSDVFIKRKLMQAISGE